jgi:hypothetical protein
MNLSFPHETQCLFQIAFQDTIVPYTLNFHFSNAIIEIT